jgi:DNA mismatch endonuclease (patch repair protein)
MTTPRYTAFTPASARASKAARGASAKRDTKCELVLRRAVFARGLRYRVDVKGLPGRPDLVFSRAKVVVFCDGDFWHGRNLAERIAKLEDGHNAPYWVAKITRNVERDGEQRLSLEREGWLVMRFWESDILKDVERIADEIVAAVKARSR